MGKTTKKSTDINNQDDNLGSGETYRDRRARNNEAVKKSRQKTRQKEQEDSVRVAQLRQENAELERKAEVIRIIMIFMIISELVNFYEMFGLKTTF